MADDKTKNAQDEKKASNAQGTTSKMATKGKKSNEVTERDRVKDKGYIQRIEEKTEKH